MVSSCSAVGCKERAVKGHHLTFHRFPKSAELREKWIKALKRKDFVPTKNSRVCEKHFTAEAYNHFASRRKLQENAVPEIFDFSGFVKDGQPISQKLHDPQRIHCIQFVDVDGVKNNNFPPTPNRTVIVIDNVVKARRVEKSHSDVIAAGTSHQNGDIASMPVIKSIFSLNTSAPKVPAVSVPSINGISPQSSFALIAPVRREPAVPVPSIASILPQSSFALIATVPKNPAVPAPSINSILPQSSFSLNTYVPQHPVVLVSSINGLLPQSPLSLNTSVLQQSTALVSSVSDTLPQSSFSLSNSSTEVTKTPISVVPRIPDVMTSDCTQKRLIGKAQQMKKKYQERLKVMNHVSRNLQKRKAFLENLLIRIKEKQLTSCEDVTDLMVDCFIEEEDEDESLSSDDDSSNNAEEYKKIIAFIDDKISKFEKAVKVRSRSFNSNECEAYGLHLESVLNAMPQENATVVKNQITEVLKKYQGKTLLKMYRDYNQTFSGLENIEMNEIE